MNFLALNSKIELKLAEETRVREEAAIAAQAYDDINQECVDHGNQARNLEMNVAKTENELRYSTHQHIRNPLCLCIRICVCFRVRVDIFVYVPVSVRLRTCVCLYICM